MSGIQLRHYLTLARRETYSTTLCMHVTKNSSKEEIIDDTQVAWPENSIISIHTHPYIYTVYALQFERSSKLGILN